MDNNKDMHCSDTTFSWLPLTDVRAACDDTCLVSELRAYLKKVIYMTNYTLMPYFNSSNAFECIL